MFSLAFVIFVFFVVSYLTVEFNWNFPDKRDAGIGRL